MNAPMKWGNFRIRSKSDGNYRYLWEAQLLGHSNVTPVTFVMLNPSTADEESTDPTIEKCLSYAYVLGYGVLRVVNLFAHRTSKPECLPKDYLTAVGPFNDRAIQDAVSDAPLIVCAWGDGGRSKANGHLLKRAEKVRKLLKEPNDYRNRLYCLGYNKSREPKHPRPNPVVVVRKNTVAVEPYCISP